MSGNPGFITVETVMFFGLGFLLAILLMLAFMPAVHHRAVRLERRKGTVVPQSLEEMQREKNQLRADFAVSTRKLEHDIEQMQEKSAAHFTDLARKADTITQLKETLDARDTLVAELQSQNTQMAVAGQNAQSELHALKIENAAKIAALHEANQRIVALMSEIAALTAALDRRIHVYDTQQHEIMALTSQGDVLRMQLEALARPARQPAHALVPAADDTIEHRVRESNEDGDVIRRALEAIQANGQGNGLSMPHGWISPPSNGAVPFGH